MRKLKRDVCSRVADKQKKLVVLSTTLDAENLPLEVDDADDDECELELENGIALCG